MDIYKLIPPPYTVSLKYFLQYFTLGQYEKAACEIKYSFETCLRLCTKEIIHFLIVNHYDTIFCTIAYMLNKQSLTINSLVNNDDFLLSCSCCNAYVISLLSNNASIKITPLSFGHYENCALAKILNRDDPQLLIKCLSFIPDLVATEPQRTAPLYYLFEHKLNNLIDEMWILINSFEIPENELLIIARNWNEFCPGQKISPILEELFSKHKYQHQYFLEICRTPPSKEKLTFVTELTDVTNHNCLDAKKNMIEADRLRQTLTERSKRFISVDKHILHITIDPKSPSILMQLPYELMKDVDFFLNSKLYLETELIGEEATGEGPVQDMFNAYFIRISSTDRYFDFDENSTSILPTQKGGNDRELHEKRCIFYGLGIVFLKILIDLRPMGNFKEDNVASIEKESLNCSLHPWIFQALLQKMEKDPKKIFYETLLSNNSFYNIMSNDTNLTDVDYLIRQIELHEMYLNCRGIYYQAMHDGFFLNYVEGLTPSEFKSNLMVIKDNLKEFYEVLQTVSPKALQFLLVGSSTINTSFLLSRFVLEPFNKIDSSGNGYDQRIEFVDENSDRGKIFRNSKQIFQDVLTEWCNEKYQLKIKAFLKYISGVSTLSPLLQQVWRIGFDFSLDNGKEETQCLMVWACDHTVRSPLFYTHQQCKDCLTRSMKEYFLDPVNRDMPMDN